MVPNNFYEDTWNVLSNSLDIASIHGRLEIKARHNQRWCVDNWLLIEHFEDVT